MILNFFDQLIKNEENIKYLIGLFLACLFIFLLFLNKKRKKIETSDVACIGIFTAFSIVLYFVKFNLPFIFPSFLEINFSLLPIIIIGYMLGPIEAVIIVVLRCLIKIPFTSTFCVGEIADLLIGIPVALVTSMIYKKCHTKKGALVSLLFGSLTWVIISIFTNYFINVPFFLQLYCNGNVEAFIGALAVIPNVTVENYMIKYILFAVIPFNLLIASVVSVVTFLVYKKISIIFNKLSKKQEVYE